MFVSTVSAEIKELKDITPTPPPRGDGGKGGIYLIR